MLEQLYFTWSTIGLGAVTGFRVRAASDGVADINGERYNSFKPYLNYALPQGTDAYAATTERSPFGLILADTGKERVIAQQVYVGKDGYNRPGVYFVHLMAGLPDQFLACDAIDLWRSSSLWDTADAKVSANSVQLPRIAPADLLQKKGSLNERTLLQAQTQVQKYLPLLIQAYLTLGENQKIYLAASNDQVAALVWGLAHSLPRTLQQTLTFSIYENDVLRATERVIGTSQVEAEVLKGYIKPAQVLPADCYSSKGIAIDCYSDKTSDFKDISQEIVNYSRYATACLVQGQKKELDGLLKIAEDLEAKDTQEFLAVCKFYSSISQDKALTQQEVTGLLSNEKLVAALLHQEKVQRAIIDLAIANPGWWNEQAAPALLKLRPPFDAPGDTKGQQAKAALSAFGVQAAQTLYATMLRNQTRSSETLMQVLYAITPPNKDVAPWLKLLQSFSAYMAQDKQFHPAKVFAWEFRAWLLQQWAFGHQHISDELILPWLQLNWNDFMNLLALPDMPEKWRRLALMQLLSRSNEVLPKQIVGLFNNSKYQPLCLGTLQELMRFASTQPAALHCFQKLVEYGYGDKIPLLIMLLDVRTASKKDILTPEMLNDFLRATRMKDKEKIEFLEEHSSLLLGAGHRELAPALVDIIKVYIDKLTVDKLLDRSAQVTLQTLDLLRKQLDKLPSNLADHISVWLWVSYGVVRTPFLPLSLEKKFLTSMGKYIVHFKLQNNKKYRESFFFVLINSIRTVDELHLILEVFMEPLEKRSGKELLYDLSAFIGERYNSNLPLGWLLPYLMAALEYSTGMKAAEDKEDFLTPLLRALLKNVNSYMFGKLNGTVATWPKAYQKDWQAYAVPPEAKSLLQKVGDVGGNMIGLGGKLGGVLGGGKGNDESRSPSRPLTNEPDTSQEEPPPPQNRNGQGSVQNQQNMQPGNQRPQSNAIQQNMGFRSPAKNQQNAGYSSERTTPQMPYNPNDYQQQGGQSYSPPPAQPQYAAPPQQYQQPTYEQTPMNPSVPPADISQYTQSVPDQVQMYTYVPQSEQPQSTVNGQPIYPKWIVTVYKLKGPYIEYRDSELKKELTQKKKQGTEWILDEQDHLRNYTSIDGTLKLLEMDVLIIKALEHYSKEFSGPEFDPQTLLEKVYRDKELQKQYKKTFSNEYPEQDIRDVLLIYVRYRILSEIFRKLNSRIKHWLDKQWITTYDQGRIVRSPNPLPDGK